MMPSSEILALVTSGTSSWRSHGQTWACSRALGFVADRTVCPVSGTAPSLQRWPAGCCTSSALLWSAGPRLWCWSPRLHCYSGNQPTYPPWWEQNLKRRRGKKQRAHPALRPAGWCDDAGRSGYKCGGGKLVCAGGDCPSCSDGGWPHGHCPEKGVTFPSQSLPLFGRTGYPHCCPYGLHGCLLTSGHCVHSGSLKSCSCAWPAPDLSCPEVETESVPCPNLCCRGYRSYFQGLCPHAWV